MMARPLKIVGAGAVSGGIRVDRIQETIETRYRVRLVGKSMDTVEILSPQLQKHSLPHSTVL